MSSAISYYLQTRLVDNHLIMCPIPCPILKVAIVRAEDPDAGWFGAIRYSILRGNSEGVFAIEENTGRVTLAMIPAKAEGKRYTLTIRATDKVREGER